MKNISYRVLVEDADILNENRFLCHRMDGNLFSLGWQFCLLPVEIRRKFSNFQFKYRRKTNEKAKSKRKSYILCSHYEKMCEIFNDSRVEEKERKRERGKKQFSVPHWKSAKMTSNKGQTKNWCTSFESTHHEKKSLKCTLFRYFKK